MQTTVSLRVARREETDKALEALREEYSKVEDRRLALLNEDETPANERRMRAIERKKDALNAEYEDRYNKIVAEEYQRARETNENIFDV